MTGNISNLIERDGKVPNNYVKICVFLKVFMNCPDSLVESLQSKWHTRLTL